MQQLLVAQAIDRALDGLEWPEVAGKKIDVETGVPGAGAGTPPLSRDQLYLQRAVEARLARLGAHLAEDRSSAELLLTVLANSIGIDRSSRFLGVGGATGGFIPVRIPELALYKLERQEGFADIEIVLSDARRGGLLHESEPSQGTTFARTRVILFIFRKRETDTRRLPPRDEQESTLGVMWD